ncbi:MAG: biosynthetic-type acetolactate synthase large subunit [Pseudomonadota bacterium]
MSSTADELASQQKTMTGAQLVIDLLEAEGVTTVFGVPGGAVLPVYDALGASSIAHVLARHEQGAGFMAQGMARVTGKAQVCIASSGPGASNLLTAVADAKMDSIPLVAITGQVSQHLLGTDAFQELDTASLMAPITKFNCMVRSVEELAELIPRAFEIAQSGRPGPVSIDIPKDVQLQQMSVSNAQKASTQIASQETDLETLDGVLESLQRAHKPIILAGAGVIKAGASAALKHFVENNEILVAHTLLGLGALPGGHPLSLGMLGMHAAPYTNHLLQECDCLLAVGARFDDRATGEPSTFCPNADVIHIDIDSRELGKIIKPSLAIQADALQFLTALNRRQQKPKHQRHPVWLQRAQQLKQTRGLRQADSDSLLQPYGLINHIADVLDDNAIITTDVGQHQMWVAQAFPFQWPGQLVTSGGLGTMGFGLPAAIGCALAEPDKTIVCFTGDGSLMMNLQELATVAEHQLNIKICVLDNGHLGLVRQQQKLFYQGNFQANAFQQRTNFVMAAHSMGVAGFNLAQSEQPRFNLTQSLQSKEPTLIACPIDEDELVLPMVPPGAANHEMIEDKSLR